MANNKVIIPLEDTYQKWKSLFVNYNIIYLYAPTGSGKTDNVKQFTSDEYHDWLYLSVLQDDFMKEIRLFYKKKNLGKVNRLIILDDLQYLTSKEEKEKLVSVILDAYQIRNNNIKIKFFLLSRAPLPVYLKPLLVTRQLVIQDMTTLIFSLEETKQLFIKEGIELNPFCYKAIYENTKGWILANVFYVYHLREGLSYSREMRDRVEKDIFDYFDITLFNEWSVEIQKFLLYMAGFPTFTIPLAQMVVVKSEEEIVAILNKIFEIGSCIRLRKKGVYVIAPFFASYLLYKQKQKFSKESIKRIYNNAGVYYEGELDIVNALACYSKADNTEKMAELLIFNLENYACASNERLLAKYFEQVDPETIAETPELLSYLAMLKSLQMLPEESEKYVSMLEDLGRRVRKTDSRYKVIQEKLVYLSIAIPHRGSKRLSRLFIKLAPYCLKNGIRVQKMSISGNMPSLLNGGKDFCRWLRRDKLLYSVLKKPIEQVLGASSAGLADIALGESLYVKNSVAESISYLTKGLSDASLRGTIEMEFAAVGIMVRAFMAEGSISAAQGIIDNIELKAKEKNHSSLIPNIHALKVQIALKKVEDAYIDEWMELEALDELEDFYTTDRFILMVKARVYIRNAQYLEALSLLKKLEYYSVRYDRQYINMECKLLQTIIFKARNEEWLPTLIGVLRQASRYTLVRLIADEGIQIYSMLNSEDFKKVNLEDEKIDANFLKQVKSELKKQADLYPNYLKVIEGTVVLSKQENKIFKELASGKTNEEIATTLNIKVSTVKFHLGNIFKKLGVNNRAMAIKEGQDRGII
jgi:LuxR family transcriptional regulator, maltose regulon positive regulatory protein